MSYYNTTQEAPSQVEIFKTSNNAQDETVLGIFQKSKRGLGASQVWNRYPIANVPITSIRRAINTLVREGFLKDSGVKAKGRYGRNEIIWELTT